MWSDGDDVSLSSDEVDEVSNATRDNWRPHWPKVELTGLAPSKQGKAEPLRRDNLVMVYIWLTKDGSTGHVSLGLHQSHISLFPKPRENPTKAKSTLERVKRKITNPTEVRPADFKPSLAKDIEGEGGKDPDIAVPFYSIGSHKLMEAFTAEKARLQQDGHGWRLVGSTGVTGDTGSSVTLQGKAESCVSLVWELLKRASFHKQLMNIKVRIQASSQMSSVVTPNRFAEFVLKAAHRERAMYERVAEWGGEHYPKGTSLKQANAVYKSLKSRPASDDGPDETSHASPGAGGPGTSPDSGG